MQKNRYYHYDHETCSFVEVDLRRGRIYVPVSVTAVAALLVAVLLTFGLDTYRENPEELALRAENEALQEQLAQTEHRLSAFAAQLEELSSKDQDLYRVLLRANPIPEDVRQVGIGGTDPYGQFDRYSAPSAKLLRQTSLRLDKIERQLGLQRESYQELAGLAVAHQRGLAEMPAILPSNGPLISGFGVRRHPILKVQKMHKGVDIVVRAGTPVYATGDGVVKEAGPGSGYGQHVVIEHAAAGYFTLYAHLSVIPPHIQPGRKVQRGEQIGLSGSTGRASGPHVHYEVHDREGRALNPVHFFAPSMTPQQYKVLLASSETSDLSLD